MPYGTPPTVEEVIAAHKAGTTDYTVGWKGMLDILVAEIERLRASPFAAAGPGMVTHDPAPHAARAPDNLPKEKCPHCGK